MYEDSWCGCWIADRFCVSDAAAVNPTDHIAGEVGRWMIFAAGLAVLVATILLPAQSDLRATRLERDRTLHLERFGEQRIERYRAFLNDLANPDEQTVQLLAISQLGQIPGNRAALIAPGERGDTNLLESIEPQPEPFVDTQRPLTRLERLTMHTRSRVWIVGGGLLAVLYGLMPATKP